MRTLSLIAIVCKIERKKIFRVFEYAKSRDSNGGIKHRRLLNSVLSLGVREREREMDGPVGRQR